MRTSIIAFFAILLFSLAAPAFAQQLPPIGGGGNSGSGTVTPGGGNTGTGGLVNPLAGQGDLQSFLSSILAFIVKIGAIVVVLMLVFVGFKFVTAQGAPGELEKAKQMLLWTLIGALVLLGAQAISVGIQATVNAISTGN